MTKSPSKRNGHLPVMKVMYIKMCFRAVDEKPDTAATLLVSSVHSALDLSLDPEASCLGTKAGPIAQRSLRLGVFLSRWFRTQRATVRRVQVVAIITATGLGVANYEIWATMVVVFLLFFVGGIARFTGSGVKVIRQVLLFKNSYKEISQLVHPQVLLPVRLMLKAFPIAPSAWIS